MNGASCQRRHSLPPRLDHTLPPRMVVYCISSVKGTLPLSSRRSLKRYLHDDEGCLKLVMITGDQALTTCYVAEQVHIVSQTPLILTPIKNSKGFEWISPDEMIKIPYSEDGVEELSVSHDLCVGGDCFMMLQHRNAIHLVIPYVKIFARVSLEQK